MRTEIASLGEFGLIDRLTEGIKLENESSKYGVGDDAAVLSYPSEKQVLVTTDLLMEGVHFDLTYVPLKHLGYKSAVVNFSDIYAMNGTPRQITVSLGLSKRFSVEDMDELYSGIRLACQQYVYEEHIPIDYQTAVMAEEFNMNLTTCALNGGEDYELLFTVSIADHEKISQMEGVRLIGHITKPELGCALITRDGQEFELKAQGWNPLKEDKQ